MYVEVYLLNNFAADACLSVLTLLLLKKKVSAKRVLVSAAVGAVSALPFPFVEKGIVLYKLFATFLTVAFLNKYDKFKQYLLHVVAFFGIAAAVGGITVALEYSSAAFDYNAISLTAKPFVFFASATIALYIFAQVRASVRFEAKIGPVAAVCTVLNNGASVTAAAIWDSGNGLTTPFGQKPVVVLSKDVAKKLSLDVDGEITADTVAGSSRLKTSSVSKLTVDGFSYGDVCVAVSPKNLTGYKIILNCALREGI